MARCQTSHPVRSVLSLAAAAALASTALIFASPTFASDSVVDAASKDSASVEVTTTEVAADPSAKVTPEQEVSAAVEPVAPTVPLVPVSPVDVPAPIPAPVPQPAAPAPAAPIQEQPKVDAVVPDQATLVEEEPVVVEPVKPTVFTGRVVAITDTTSPQYGQFLVSVGPNQGLRFQMFIDDVRVRPYVYAPSDTGFENQPAQYNFLGTQPVVLPGQTIYACVYPPSTDTQLPAGSQSCTEKYTIPGGQPVDSDGDGVPDNVDTCPGTPAGTAVDDKGCAIVVPDPVETTRDEPAKPSSIEKSLTEAFAKCGDDAVLTGAQFNITNYSSVVPSIDVTLSDGSVVNVALSRVDGKAAKYQLSLAPGVRIVSASAEVPKDWTGEFQLSHYDCGEGEEPEEPTPGLDPAVVTSYESGTFVVSECVGNGTLTAKGEFTRGATIVFEARDASGKLLFSKEYTNWDGKATLVVQNVDLGECCDETISWSWSETTKSESGSSWAVLFHGSIEQPACPSNPSDGDDGDGDDNGNGGHDNGGHHPGDGCDVDDNGNHNGGGHGHGGDNDNGNGGWTPPPGSNNQPGGWNGHAGGPGLEIPVHPSVGNNQPVDLTPIQQLGIDTSADLNSNLQNQDDSKETLAHTGAEGLIAIAVLAFALLAFGILVVRMARRRPLTAS